MPSTDQFISMWGNVPPWMTPIIPAIALIAVIITVLNVWFYWRILEKAGYSPWWSLFAIINGAQLIINGFLAFLEWPRDHAAKSSSTHHERSRT